ncbi:MAG: flagellar L-ring protein FlgH [Burkholderiales bacterium]|jgi:flagellar L-ring protein precursor FlgH
MTRFSSTLVVVALAAGLAGCATTPSSIVMQPTATPRPEPTAAAAPANGAIFQAAAYRPMFEDRRARLAGDMLTIAINEKTSAEKKAGSSASKSGSVNASAPSILGLGASSAKFLGATAQASSKYEEKGGDSSSNVFTGQLTVTVMEVLSNGNLVVSGEKQVALDKGVEFIRFSGVVNPTTITAGNVVSSTQVADARVEYRTNRRVDKAEMMSMLTRFFLSVLPL